MTGFLEFDPLGPPHNPNEQAGKFGQYESILTKPLTVLINNLVTNDFQQVDAQTWTNATEERERLVREKGGNYEHIAKFLNDILYLYTFEFFKKSVTLDLDGMAVKWDAAKERFKSENAMRLYADFRSNPLYAQTIDKLYNVVKAEMSDKDSEWYAAREGWTNARVLIKKCHDTLKRVDPDYRDLINTFDAADRDDIESFIYTTAWYDITASDLRSEISRRELGMKRKAVKHLFGLLAEGSDQAFSWLSKVIYQVGKNSDRGLYASALVWLELPQDLMDGEFDLSTESGRRDQHVQQERVHDRSHAIDAFVKYMFGNNQKAADKAAAKRWKPESYADGMPPLSGLMRTQRIDPTTGERERPGNNALHYEQTKEALIKIYLTVSEAWKSDMQNDWDKLNDTEFATAIHSKIKDIGTQVAIALAYTNGTPDWKVRSQLLDSMRAAVDAYIIYLLAQIKKPQGFKAWVSNKFLGGDKKYERRYKLAVDTIVDYLDINDSLRQTYYLTDADRAAGLPIEQAIKDAKDEIAAGINVAANRDIIRVNQELLKEHRVTLNALLIETAQDKDFKKQHMIFHGDAVYIYNMDEAKHEGIADPGRSLTTDEKFHGPHWPWNKPSDRDAHKKE